MTLQKPLGVLMLWAMTALALKAAPPPSTTPPRTPPVHSAIQEAMQRFVDQQELAGAITLVGRGDAILHEGVVGFRDLEARAPMTPQTLFRIASMTKPMTALCILMLHEEGRLNPEDPVEKYLPEFRDQKLRVETGPPRRVLQKPPRPITLADLMTHTSGLPSGYPVGLGDVYTRRHLSLKETTLVIAQQPLEFEPGSHWSYCNAGIDVLGRVVEVVSGDSFESFLQKRLFDPLEMTDSRFVIRAEDQIRLARVYDQREGQLVAQPLDFRVAGPTSRFPMPAGGLYSTVGDLSKFYACLLKQGRGPRGPIVKPETLQRMTRTQTDQLKTGFTDGMSFGYGFQVVKTPQGVTRMLLPGTFGHGGAFGTQGWVDPKSGLYLILLIQRTGLKNGDASIYREKFQELAMAQFGRAVAENGGQP